MKSEFDSIEIISDRNVEAELKTVASLPELHDMRLAVLTAMKANDGRDFERIQKAFIAAQNRLKRIPLKDR